MRDGDGAARPYSAGSGVIGLAGVVCFCVTGPRKTRSSIAIRKASAKP
jgi:hypothetical protein